VGDGPVALSALRHAPAGDVLLLGLFAVFDHLFDVPAVPACRRRSHRLLRQDRRRAPLRGDEMMACWERPDPEPVVLFAVG